MDSRAAAAALERIGHLLELRGDNPFKTRAYHNAARALTALDLDDLAPAFRDGTLEDTPGLGPGTLAVVRDLVNNGHSHLLDQLAAETPPGLIELLRVPGLGTSKIHQLHATLGVDSLDALEAAARDGRLAGVKGFGAKTAAKIADGIAFLRASAGQARWDVAAVEAARVAVAVGAQPGVEHAEVAGEVRRRLDVVRAVDVVAAVAPDLPVRTPAAHGVEVRLTRAAPAAFALALWRATGNEAHVAQVAARLAARGYTLRDDAARGPDGGLVTLQSEADVYRLAGLEFVPPELREGMEEVEAAATHALPRLVEGADLRGVLHCHTTYSDGRASVAEMAEAARARGWSYLGVTDHSQSAAYAGGLTPAAVIRQHAEIDRVNEDYAARGVAFRVLKGIECDILDDGALDYADPVLERFEFVIGSVHSRFGLSERQMTDRVCRAVANPFLTVLGHPTGRLLLERAAYALDVHAVLAAAAEHGAAVELNADPHRLDLDWRELRGATARGITIEIGPDAHSPAGLGSVDVGVGVARKGWLEAGHVLNARDADGVLAFARAKREGGGGR